MTNIRTYVYGTTIREREFLHSFLDEPAALKYIQKHSKLFPRRFEGYALYHGDTCYKEISVNNDRTESNSNVS